MGDTDGNKKNQTQCLFFSEVYPYNVWALNRTLAINASDVHEAFFGPILMTSRIFSDDWYNLYMSPESPGVLTGLLEDAMLVLDVCMEACVQNLRCTAIAFPGCWLLEIDNIRDREKPSTPLRTF